MNSDTPNYPEIHNLWDFLEPSLIKHKNKTAWITFESKKEKRVIKYKQLYEAALTYAALLRTEGVEAGDTVGVTAPNGPEWFVATLAAWKLGAVVAPIHIGNSEADIAMQVEAIKPKAMLGYKTTQLTDNQHLIDLTPNPETIDAESKIIAPSTAESVALFIYTSGSTGSPKVVKLSHNNLAANVLSACELVSVNSSDRFISLLPLSHAMGITATMLLPLYVGARCVSPRVIAASEIIKVLASEKITFLVAVPRLFRNIMLGMDKKFANGSFALKAYLSLLAKLPPSLRRRLNKPIRHKVGGNINVWISGGSHLDGKISEYFHRLGIPLRQGYGLTETAPMVCVQEEFDTNPDSVGKPVLWSEVKIVDPDHLGRGELYTRGPNVMLGYTNDAITETEIVDGWFKTGDIARTDPQGNVFLTGRSKRLIVTDAGKNVYPEELETLLERDPRLKEAGVFDFKDKPVAVLALDPEFDNSTAREILKSFNNFVSSHNQIKRYAVVDELPRTPLGKVALPKLPDLFDQYEVK